jgi:hypothetical protein
MAAAGTDEGATPHRVASGFSMCLQRGSFGDTEPVLASLTEEEIQKIG